MTRVNWNRQLGLAATLFVLGSAAVWLEYKHKPEKEAKEEQAKKLFQLKDTPVQRIQLFKGNQEFAFNCSDFSAKLCKPTDQSKWEVQTPLKVKADDSNVNQLLSTLSGLSTSDTIDMKADTSERRTALLREYGLDPASRAQSPKIVITTGTDKTTVYLGQVHPIGDALFTLIGKGDGAPDETQVYLVSSYFKANLDHDLTYWRNKKLATLASHEVGFFDYKGPRAEVKGTRKAGQWALQTREEPDLPGDIENIDNLLTATTYLTAKTFVSENKASPAAQTALKGFTRFMDLTLQKEKGEAKDAPTPITLTLYQSLPKPAVKGTPSTPIIYATVSNLDPLYELDASAKTRFDKELKDLRMTKLITSMDRFSAKKIEFSGSPLGADLKLESANGKWVNTSNKEEVSADKLQDLLEKLSGSRIRDFYVGRNIPVGEEKGIHFTLRDEKNAVQRQLLFWKQGDRLIGKDLLGKRNEAFLVDNTVRDHLPWDRDFFAKKKATP